MSILRLKLFGRFFIFVLLIFLILWKILTGFLNDKIGWIIFMWLKLYQQMFLFLDINLLILLMVIMPYKLKLIKKLLSQHRTFQHWAYLWTILCSFHDFFGFSSFWKGKKGSLTPASDIQYSFVVLHVHTTRSAANAEPTEGIKNWGALILTLQMLRADLHTN